MEVTHEASTAMGMAFTSWRMSRGKVYQVHLRIHDHEGLHILLTRAELSAREGQNSPIVRRNWGMEVAPEASTAMGMAFTSVGGCPWARFMSFICESMANRVSNEGQMHAGGASLRTGRFRSSFAGIGAWK